MAFSRHIISGYYGWFGRALSSPGLGKERLIRDHVIQYSDPALQVITSGMTQKATLVLFELKEQSPSKSLF